MRRTLDCVWYYALASLFCASCGEDSTAPSASLNVSDIGTLESVEVYDGERLRIYEYDNVQFVGDMTLADYDSLSSLVIAEFGPEEVMLRVVNFKHCPSASRYWQSPGVGVLVYSCVDGYPQNCQRGKWWRMTNDLGQWSIQERGAWIIMSEATEIDNLGD